MASTQPQLRLKWHARWLLIVAAVIAGYLPPLRIPRAWVMAVTNRAWQVKVNGKWQSIRIDSTGRILQ